MTTTAKRPATRALRLLLGQPWAITKDALELIVSIAKRENQSPEAVAAELGRPLVNTRSVTVRDGVAMIPIAGPMFRYANLFTEISGATSMEVVATDFARALNDPAVGAIVLAIDSPGGEVNGVSELAAMIYSARGRKPVVAHVSGFGASGAYWLASAADEVITSDTGILGSIGAMLHLDSGDPEDAGIDIVSSQTPNKNRDPQTEEGRAQIQAVVDQLAGVFIASVAKYRDMSEAKVLEQSKQGGLLVGREAVKAGLADRMATYEQVHAMLVERTNAGRISRPSLRVAADVAPIAAELKDLAGLSDLAAACLKTGILARSHLAGASPLTPVALSTSALSDSRPHLAGTKEEARMEPKDKETPDPASTATADPVKVERERVKAVMAVAKEHGFGAKAAKWIEDGLTVEQVNAEILARYRQNGADPLAVPAAEEDTPPVKVRGVASREAKQPYASLGEQLQDIAAMEGANVKPQGGHAVAKERLMNVTAAISGAGAGVGSDGGFAIQKDFSVDLTNNGLQSGELLSRCSQTEVGSNSDGLEVAYIDETSRATGSRWGGVQIYRGAEADAANAKKPKVGKWECRLEDLIGLAYMTERLLADAPAMASVFSESFADEYGFIGDNEVYRGSGVGQMQGILNAPGTVSVAKEVGQAAATIVALNIMKMWARVLPRAKKNGVWFINTDCTPQLSQLQVGTGVSGQMVYMPPGGLSGLPYATLYGRPVIEIEHAETVGTVGDLSFLDLAFFKVITKGGIQQDESIHVKFANNERTFRWISRINGAPKLRSAITPFKGTATLAPFVTLATRS